MTHLRQAMLDELQRRNYAKTTIQYYIQAVKGSRSIFTARRTNSIKPTSASIRPTCCATANSSRGR